MGRRKNYLGSSMCGCARANAFGSSRRVGVDGEIEDFRFPIFDFGNVGQNDGSNAVAESALLLAVLESMVCGVDLEFIE